MADMKFNVVNRFSTLLLAICLPACAVTGLSQAPAKTELATGWELAGSLEMTAEGAQVSTPAGKSGVWHSIRRMPATVLEILQEDGVYPDLYFGTNLAEKVPQDLFRQDWWYRTEFNAPAGAEVYSLEFPGINYRAEIWLNGRQVADSRQVVGMYVAHQLDVSQWIKPGERNVLAVKVTPERLVQDVDGVELADSWFDWINWKYLGYHGAYVKQPPFGASFVPDRNAGIWKPVWLKTSGKVAVEHPAVNTDLDLKQDLARLTVYADLRNWSSEPESGTLKGTIGRAGKPSIAFEKPIRLEAGEVREEQFAPDRFPELAVAHPDLWWPYTMGNPALYTLKLEYVRDGRISDAAKTRFGIRSVVQLRDHDEEFPDKGKGGNFYLQINGRDFRARGGDYTPDLLYRDDPDREAWILRYVKDMGANMLRWESKISSERIVDLADEQGIPLMFGWMCCNQWEKWDQWNEEDYRVAPESLRSQIQMLRSHASVIVWANGSDGRPPDPLRLKYRDVLSQLHWQNAIVDTVSSFAKDAKGEHLWDGVNMEGPYSWRSPAYWFSGKYPPTRGASAEQGDNEHIPTLESLKRFIPADKLWPINDTWYVHAGSLPGANTLADVQLAVNTRYGPSSGVEEFVRKAQLAHYEATRAQFENFAAGDWANHKMLLYWMLNSHWPSFYGNIIDYFLSPGGSFFGAKKGLRPLSVVFDAYATGDRSRARILVFNQTPSEAKDLHVRIRVYDLDGKLHDEHAATVARLASNGSAEVLSLPRYPGLSGVFFVRCQLLDGSGKLIVDNTYWQSQKDDELGDRSKDDALNLKQERWADMTALNTMPKVQLKIAARRENAGGDGRIIIQLRNPSAYIAFFERTSISDSKDGSEILPVLYDDNYVTVYPGETVEIRGTVSRTGQAQWVRVEGYNSPGGAVRIE
jgi:exo-1,4-beta-D-glucosaminidase